MGDNLKAANKKVAELDPEIVREWRVKGGKKGHKKWMENTTPEQRKEQARKAALKRWRSKL